MSQEDCIICWDTFEVGVANSACKKQHIICLDCYVNCDLKSCCYCRATSENNIFFINERCISVTNDRDYIDYNLIYPSDDSIRDKLDFIYMKDPTVIPLLIFSFVFNIALVFLQYLNIVILVVSNDPTTQVDCYISIVVVLIINTICIDVSIYCVLEISDIVFSFCWKSRYNPIVLRRS